MTHSNESRPAGDHEATETFGGVVTIVSPIDDRRRALESSHGDHYDAQHLGAPSTKDYAGALAQRIEMLGPQHLLDAWASATARYWRRRAETFEDARPARDGFHGRATRDQLNARWERLTSIAAACRNRATYADLYGPTDADLALIVGVATALEVHA